MNSRVFRTLAIFRKPYSIFLSFSEGKCYLITSCYNIILVSQISHSLVVILELSSVSEVQYKEIMIIDDE